jgi:aryl-alcohol dehydrogenase-like predicted oxidoreductase
VVKEIASEVGRTPAEVSLRWVVERPGVSSVLIGASRVEQLEQNVSSLDVELTAEHLARLEQATTMPLINPYFIFNLPLSQLFGGHDVRRG